MKLDRKGLRNVVLFWIAILGLVLGFVANARVMMAFVVVDIFVVVIAAISYGIYDLTRD